MAFSLSGASEQKASRQVRRAASPALRERRLQSSVARALSLGTVMVSSKSSSIDQGDEEHVELLGDVDDAEERDIVVAGLLVDLGGHRVPFGRTGCRLAGGLRHTPGHDSTGTPQQRAKGAARRVSGLGVACRESHAPRGLDDAWQPRRAGRDTARRRQRPAGHTRGGRDVRMPYRRRTAEKVWAGDRSTCARRRPTDACGLLQPHRPTEPVGVRRQQRALRRGRRHHLRAPCRCLVARQPGLHR